jgi:ribonuclease T2
MRPSSFSAARVAAFCLAAFLSTTLCHAGAAEDIDCILDNCADRAPPRTPSAQQGRDDDFRVGGPSRPFDFYVLALSWSPGFCDTVGGFHDQCEPGKGLGFVVHGLWPQYEHGYPSDCAGPRAPSRMALDRANGVFPDERLARYEWRKHGTCSGKSPSDYFAEVARARALIDIPAPFRNPHQEQAFTPIDIERAFYDANPRLRPGMMAVGCRRNTFEEVRICLSKDLRDFVACPEIVRHGCRQRELTVPAPM